MQVTNAVVPEVFRVQNMFHIIFINIFQQFNTFIYSYIYSEIWVFKLSYAFKE